MTTTTSSKLEKILAAGQADGLLGRDALFQEIPGRGLALAAGLGLAKGTLYLYFPSKESLFLALLGELLDASNLDGMELGVYDAWMPPAVYLTLQSGEELAAAERSTGVEDTLTEQLRVQGDRLEKERQRHAEERATLSSADIEKRLATRARLAKVTQWANVSVGPPRFIDGNHAFYLHDGQRHLAAGDGPLQLGVLAGEGALQRILQDEVQGHGPGAGEARLVHAGRGRAGHRRGDPQVHIRAAQPADVVAGPTTFCTDKSKARVTRMQINFLFMAAAPRFSRYRNRSKAELESPEFAMCMPALHFHSYSPGIGLWSSSS